MNFHMIIAKPWYLILKLAIDWEILKGSRGHPPPEQAACMQKTAQNVAKKPQMLTRTRRMACGKEIVTSQADSH